MSRVIKFRVWHEGQMLMQPINTPFAASRLFGFLDAVGVHAFDDVMQFTGLHDRNGKEIYEGDIIEIELDKDRAFTDGKTDVFRLVIEWDGCGFSGIRTDNNMKYSPNFGGSAVTRKEIIGNRFEHPQLLK